jgi:thermitase
MRHARRVLGAVFLTLTLTIGASTTGAFAQQNPGVGPGGPQPTPTPHAGPPPAVRSSAASASGTGEFVGDGGARTSGASQAPVSAAAQKRAVAPVKPIPTITPPAGVPVLPKSDQTITIQRGNRSLQSRAIKQAVLADGRNVVADRIVVGFKDNVPSDQRQAVHAGAAGRGAGKAQAVAAVGPNAHLVNVAGSSIDAALNAYRADPRVAYAEPDAVVTKADVPNDPLFGQQWGMSRMQMTQAWNTTQGNGATIAILDCGIFDESSQYLGPDGHAGHPDLRGKVVQDIDFTGSPYGADDLCDHGTHVAGIAAADTGNGVGVAGVAYNARLLNGKVLDDSGNGSTSGIEEGIYWAANAGAQVINMSLGGLGACPTAMQAAIDYAWSRGLVIVAAAGNQESSVGSEPGDCNHVVSVASTDSNDAMSYFSNFGSSVSVAAPGGADVNGHGIQSTNYLGEYEEKEGTSMSTPHVAGLAALLFATGWGTSNQAVVDRLEHTADQSTGAAIPNLGSQWTYGRVNAARAVLPPQPSTITTSTTSLPVNTTVRFNWTITNPTPWDWIGVYHPGDPDSSPLATTLVNCTQTPTVAVDTGSCGYAPPGIGTYEFRLFADSTYFRIGVSAPVTVTRAPPASFNASPNSISPGVATTISWAGLTAGTPSDWIGLYAANAPDTAYLYWQ